MNESLDLQYDRLLGEGAYGKVFLVKQQDGEQFAVKEIDLCRCDEDGREQALREASLLSRLSHDSILKYIDSCVSDDCLYIITEYCGGGDLEDYWQLCARLEYTLPESLVSEWIFEIGGALKYLHDQKILHRDMKTKNIFLTTEMKTKLGDLGIAKVLDLNQSKADTFVGTPSYMSPELFLGKSYNHKTDIWGLGCCVYEVMTFRRAFKGRALWTIIREIKSGKVPELPEIYSLELRTLVHDMMSQQPEARPSAKEIVKNDLLLYHRILEGGVKDILPRIACPLGVNISQPGYVAPHPGAEVLEGRAVEDIQHLPVPNEETYSSFREKKSSGNLSGSFKNMLRQRGLSDEDQYRNSMARISRKINSVRLTQGSDTGEECGTFVYHGDSDSEDEELEAGGTILDNSLLKQFTEQLDTFVYKGDNDSDSDYATGDSVNKGKVNSTSDDFDNDDADGTLIRQYSSTLEENEEEENLEDQDAFDEKAKFPVVHLKSELSKTSEQTVNFDSFKYKYKGLKDTFQLKSNKVIRRRADEIFSEDKSRKSAIRTRSLNESDVKNKVKTRTKSGNVVEGRSEGSKSKHGFPMSASFSGSSSLPLTGKNSKQQFSRTQFFEDAGDSTVKPGKMKVCDKIVESTKVKQSKPVTDRPPRKPKQAFVKEKVTSDFKEYFDDPDKHVRNVISHLKDNITPYAFETDPFESEEVYYNIAREQGSPENDQASKGKKKKHGFLKKQADVLRRSSVDETSSSLKEPDIVKEGERNVTLFASAQSVKFNRDNSDDDNDIITSHRPSKELNGSIGRHRQEKEELEKLLKDLKSDESETLTNAHRIAVQTSLTKAIGMENLQHVLDIMSMINDEQEIKAHLMNRLGPKVYEDYEQHLEILRLLELRGAATR